MVGIALCLNVILSFLIYKMEAIQEQADLTLHKQPLVNPRSVC